MSKVMQLKDICSKASSNIAQKDITNSDGSFPIYGASGFIKNVDFYKQEKEYIGIVKDGAGVGRAMLLPPKSSVIGTIQYILPKENVLAEYLYYILTSIDLAKYSTGATIPHIYFKDYSNEKVLVPTVSEQKKQVSTLNKASKLISLRKKQLEELDALAESIFYDMFGDPVKNEKGWETKTISSLIKNTPNSLKRGPFGGALKKEIFVDKGFLVYEQYHALNNDFSFARYFITEQKYHELENFAVNPDDIIISCSGVNLGKLSVLPKDAKKGIINQALLKISLNQDIMCNKVFVRIFENESFKDKYFGNQRGCAIPNFPPMSDFKKFEFPVPPIEFQNEYVSIIEKIESQKSLVKQALQESEDLFQRLMQDLFKPH